MRQNFALVLRIGLLILLYSGVFSGVTALFEGGFVWMLNVVFNPFIFSGFWFVVTLAQDILIVVGAIGVLLTKDTEENGSQYVAPNQTASNPEVTPTSNPANVSESNPSNDDIFGSK